MTEGNSFSRSLRLWKFTPAIDDLLMGYTFAHIEVHSRKGGKSGSVGYVLDEAQRLPGTTPHVDVPAPPELVDGMPLVELRQLHDNRSDTCRVTLDSGRVRRIRQDQNTLMSVVLSFPQEMTIADPTALKDWEDRSVAWLRKQFGDRLKTVVRHVDEKHPHLHAYALDDGPEMRAAALHPGYQAKAAALAAGEENKAGDRAYRDAMRDWQDRYWRDVGLPCGLARLGPGRRRLTRDQWRQEQTSHRAVRTAVRAQQHLKGKGVEFIARTKVHADEIRKSAEAEAAVVAASAKAGADAIRAAAVADARTMRGTARRALQEAQDTLRRVSGLGNHAAAAWASARAFLAGQKEKIEARIQDEVSAVQGRLEADVSSAKRSLQEERQKTKGLKSTVTALGSELKEARREIQRLQPADRPGPGNIFRP